MKAVPGYFTPDGERREYTRAVLTQGECAGQPAWRVEFEAGRDVRVRVSDTERRPPAAGTTGAGTNQPGHRLTRASHAATSSPGSGAWRLKIPPGTTATPPGG